MNSLTGINPAVKQMFDRLDNFGFGFEDQFNLLNKINDSWLSSTSYPPYNIKRNGNLSTIEIALAGFSKEDILIVVKNNTLTVSGDKKESSTEPHEIISRGIASRKFVRIFALSDKTKVSKASMINGMLTITIEKITSEEDKEISVPID